MRWLMPSTGSWLPPRPGTSGSGRLPGGASNCRAGQAGGARQAIVFCYDYVMQDASNTQPGPDPGVDLSAEAASQFLVAAGLVVDAAGGTRVAGHIDLGPDHHTPWGVVHGGVYTAAVESAASLGASLAVRDRGQFAVGVHNATDFLRPATSGRAEVVAEPLQQGRVQQLWLVTITDERGRALARGQLRLQNVPLPGTGTGTKLTSGPAGRQHTRPRRVLSSGACEHASDRSEPRPGPMAGSAPRQDRGSPLSYEPSRSGGQSSPARLRELARSERVGLRGDLAVGTRNGRLGRMRGVESSWSA